MLMRLWQNLDRKAPKARQGQRVTLESLARLVQRALRAIRVNPERLALREIRANLVSLLKSNGTR